jgi:hypothetical protein
MQGMMADMECICQDQRQRIGVAQADAYYPEYPLFAALGTPYLQGKSVQIDGSIARVSSQLGQAGCRHSNRICIHNHEDETEGFCRS